MKRAFILLITVSLLIVGCGTEETETTPETPPITASLPQTTLTSVVEKIDEPPEDDEPIEYNEIELIEKAENNPQTHYMGEEIEFDYSPLELIGYYIDYETKRVMLDDTDWLPCEPDVFREYMFGTWEGEEDFWGEEFFVLDDSEYSEPFNYRFAFDYQRRDDTIIFTMSDYQSVKTILWLDVKEPKIIYCTGMNGGWLFEVSRLIFPDYYLNYYLYNDAILKNIKTLTKTDTPVNEPDSNFMSRLRLLELMREYEISREMIYNIEYPLYYEEGEFFYFSRNGNFISLPIYLILKEPDKLVFKSELMYGYGFAFIDVVYTIEKINNEWQRTVEFDEDKIEELRATLV